MSARKIFFALPVIICCAILGYTESPVEMGTRLSKENDDRPTFQKVKSQVQFKIYSSSGQLRFKKKLVMAAYTENMGSNSECEKYISYFMSPPDDKGNAYLAYNYKKQSDVKYVYLKGLRKAKKVTGADKRLSFFGSDFTNGDMGKPDFLEWNYRYLGDAQMTFKGKKFSCYKIEAVPKSPSLKRELGYGRRVTYMEKKTRLSLLLEYYDLNMKKYKEMRLRSFVKDKNIKGQLVYYETGLEMKNVQTGSRTILEFIGPKFEANANVRPDIFTVQYLTRKWW